MRNQKYGWAIVGCGVIGYWHDLAVKRNSDRAEVVAYCDADRGRAEKFNSQYAGGQAAVYDDFRRLVRDPKVDIISVCTPSGLHLEPVLAAAEAGKHVLCEKPVEIRLDRIDRMAEAVDKSGIKLGVVFQRRTYEPAQKIRRAVAEEVFGKIVLGNAYLKFFRSSTYYRSGAWRGTWSLDGGGALMNQGIHGIDLLLWFLGKVQRVHGRVATLARDIEVEDTAAAVLEFASGALGVVEGSTAVNPPQPMRVAIQGTNGSVVFEENKIVRWATGGNDEQLAHETSLPPEEAEPAGGKVSGKELEALGHIRHVADLIEAIQEDRDPLVPVREARKSVELILAIYESSRLGKPVDLG